jgi:hypothetical protein
MHFHIPLSPSTTRCGEYKGTALCVTATGESLAGYQILSSIEGVDLEAR